MIYALHFARFLSILCASPDTNYQIKNMTRTIIHVDHRKVEIEIRNAPNGRKLVIAIRDAGASEMQKPNPLGAYIRQQWNKTYIYKRCAGWVSISASQMQFLNEITA